MFKNALCSGYYFIVDNNKVATRTKCIFKHAPTISNCMQNLRGEGSKFFISHFARMLQRIVLKDSNM